MPSTNSATATYTAKSSIVTYDSLGKEVVLDVYMTKTADNTWEVAIYNKADATAGANSFPYSSAAMATGTLNFDPTTGSLTAASLSSLSLAIPGGADFTLGLKGMVQLAPPNIVS